MHRVAGLRAPHLQPHPEQTSAAPAEATAPSVQHRQMRITWGGREKLLVKPFLVPPGDDDRHRLHPVFAQLEKPGHLARHHVAAERPTTSW